MNELATVAPASGLSTRLDEAGRQARDYATSSRSPRTKTAYTSDWQRFTSWCLQFGLSPLPATPQTICLYLTDHASSHKASTLQRWLVSISQAHKFSSLESPTRDVMVSSVFSGIRRRHGSAQEGKSPVLVEDLIQMVNTLDDSLLGKRNRALLLIGFAGAFRRSELVGLDVEDLTFSRQGLILHLRRSKTDQEGLGFKKAILRGRATGTCPVESVAGWLAVANISTGPIFRATTHTGDISERRLSDRSVALIVKQTAAAAGLDPKRFSGHSLRAGLATSAAIAGADNRAIKKQTGHKSDAMVERYIRDADLWRDNVTGRLGL